MKNRTIIFLMFLLFFNNLFGQESIKTKVDTVYFETGFMNIPETDYRNCNYTVCKIPLKCIWMTNKDIQIKVNIETTKNNDRIIFFDNFKTLKNSLKNDSIIFVIKNDSIIREKNRDVYTLTLSSEDEVSFRRNEIVVEIDDFKDIYLSNGAYKFSLGTNFDFADGVKPMSLYAELSTFYPDLIPLKNSQKRKSIRSLGIYGGVYQNRYISQDSNTVNVIFHRGLIIQNDTVELKESYIRKKKVQINNLGFYFGGLLQLFNSSKGDYDFNSYLSLHFELLQQKAITNYSFESVSIDTIFNSTEKLEITPFKLPTQSFNYNNLCYIGLGLPMQVKNDKVELNFCPCFGEGWINHGKLQLFYLYKFSFAEYKYGICIGGEFRGFFGHESTSISLYLSKLLDISKLIEYM
jgi:hypothetical protein